MKSCTKHSLERWTERIVGITTKKERDDYIRDNREQIAEHMNKSFDYAEFIYKGQIGDNVTRNYYIQGNMIFVMNTTDDAFITVYKVDFNFTDEINLHVAKELVREIHRLVAEKEEVDFKILEEVELKQSESEQLEIQIKILNEQAKILSDSKRTLDESVKVIKSKSRIVDLDIQKYTNQLVNSKEYREDIKTM